MRYILPVSILLSSCSLPFLRRSPPPYEKIVVVVSYDGKGLSAVEPDTAAKVVRISLIGDYGESEFHFSKSVHFGRLDEGTGSYVMDPKMVAILEADVGGKLSEANLKISRKLKSIKIPSGVRLLKPDSDLPDWDTITVRWEGKARMYVVRLYAFTMMTQKDDIVLVDSTSYTFDLSSLYGNGFLSVKVCPLGGSDPRSEERVKVFALGRCITRTFIVGDPKVWEGETPSPPWNGDDLLWYLLMM